MFSRFEVKFSELASRRRTCFGLLAQLACGIRRTVARINSRTLPGDVDMAPRRARPLELYESNGLDFRRAGFVNLRERVRGDCQRTAALLTSVNAITYTLINAQSRSDEILSPISLKNAFEMLTRNEDVSCRGGHLSLDRLRA